MTAKIIYENEIRNNVFLDQKTIQAAESSFVKYSSGKVVMPPVMQMIIEEFDGQACIKSGYMKGDPFFVTKLASIFGNNHLHGLPNSTGLMLVVNARTGIIDTILLDNGFLTALRTAAAGAVAAKYLSNPNASTVALIGAGKQARLQLKGLKLVRNIKKALVWSHTGESAQSFSRAMSRELDIPVKAYQDVESVVSQADIVVTTTPSREPLVQAEWLKSGTHITSVGADAPNKVELDPRCALKADYYVCDSFEQSKKLGELRSVQETGIVNGDLTVLELGDVITGRHKLERKSADISICDLTGLGIQDAEIAVLAKNLCEKQR